MSTTRWAIYSLLPTSNAKVTPQGVTTSDATFTALLTDTIIEVDASGGARTVTLPTPVAADGKYYLIKKTDVSGNIVTIKSTAKTIDLLNFIRLISYGEILEVVSNGTDWLRSSAPIVMYHSGEVVTLNNEEVTL